MSTPNRSEEPETIDVSERDALLGEASRIAETVVERDYEQHPELSRFGPSGRQRYVEDVAFHVRFLGEAAVTGSAALFRDYIDWTKVVLEARRVPSELLGRTLDYLRAALSGAAVPAGPALLSFLEAGRARVDRPVETPGLFVPEGGGAARDYLDALLSRNQLRALDVVSEARRHLPDAHVLLDVLRPAQLEVGRLWQLNRISVAEEHYCTAVTQLAVSRFYAEILSAPDPGRPRMVATGVAGELHEIGVRMVTDLFELDGWNTVYLGANTPSEAVVAAVRDAGASVLAVSTTMPYHLTETRRLVSGVKQALAHPPRILVGGYAYHADPERLSRYVGADVYVAEVDESVPRRATGTGG